MLALFTIPTVEDALCKCLQTQIVSPNLGLSCQILIYLMPKVFRLHEHKIPSSFLFASAIM